MDDDESAVRAVLESVNESWRSGPRDEIVERMSVHVADDAVIVGPDLTRVARVRPAFCQSYVDLEKPVIDLLADVAVATTAWRMRYTYEGTDHAERGYDIFVLRRTADRWAIVWRKVAVRKDDSRSGAATADDAAHRAT